MNDLELQTMFDDIVQTFILRVYEQWGVKNEALFEVWHEAFKSALKEGYGMEEAEAMLARLSSSEAPPAPSVPAGNQ